MEFTTVNHINTTTQIAVNSNTTTASRLFNRDPYFQWYSSGLNNDATTASITITFDETTSVSRIALIDTNANQFRLFYNGATANTFALTGGSTSTSAWTTNSQGNLYLRSSTVSCSSVTLEITSTQVANTEKVLSLFVLSDLYFASARIPSANDYKPKVFQKQVVHRLSDGGTRIQNIRKKWDININFDYLTESQRDSLLTIYDLQNAFNFIPFGTTTSWDAILFEAVWEGDFGFYEYSDNAIASGFSGNIKLKETAY